MFTNMDYVYEVYKEGSISRAAKNLYISQPSLSASIKRIEDKIGYPIFDRSTKPLKLTEIGQKYIDCMMSIRNKEKEFTDYVNDYGELKTGKLRLGGTNLVSSLIAPKIMRKFQERYPHIDVELTEGTTADLEEMLSRGAVDMIIDYSLPSYEAFDDEMLTNEALVLTVPKSCPVNESLKAYQIPAEAIRDGSFLSPCYPSVSLKEFAEVPFVLLKKKNDTYKRAIAMCSEAGFEPRISFETAQQMTAYHVSCSGLGAAFVSSLLLSRVSANPDVVFYKLDSPSAFRQLSIYWKKDRYQTKAMQEFIRTAKEEVNEEA